VCPAPPRAAPPPQGDEEAARRGCKKSILERRAPPTFPVTIEMRARGAWVAHDTAASVDALLAGRVPDVQLRCSPAASPAGSPASSLSSGDFAGDAADCQVSAATISYDCVEDALAADALGAAAAGAPGGKGGAGGRRLPAEEELLALASAAAAAAGGSASGSLGPGGEALGELPGADPRVWVERLKGLPEEEAMRQLSLLRYMGGDAGVMRPRGRGGFMGAGGSSGGAGAGAGAAGKKKGAAKRGAAARAARR
jgi:hypothetical protein